ncbi:MAG: Rv2732c family membrane protein [Segniliparus sp.]|uniref:Rv2732c family membrane protein n=1 Tax=Segniliparus sp. TaxID=2804064 RepID=UPI003F2E1E0F
MSTDGKEPVPDALAELESELRASERRILAEIEPSARLFVVAVAVFLLVADLLVVPFVGANGAHALGRELVAGGWPQQIGQVSKIARLFVFFVVADLVVSVLALVLRRWGAAFLAAAASCVSSALGVLAVWHSQTSLAGHGTHAGAATGLYLAVVLIVVIAFNWVRLTTARLGAQ